MSQKVHRTASSRYWIVIEIQRLCKAGASLNEACKTMNVSPTSYRRWRDRLETNPEFKERETIEMSSQRPMRLARQVSDSTRQRVIEAAKQPHHQSANSIAEQLRAEGIKIGNAKVNEILAEEGLFGEIYIRQLDGGFKRKRGLLRLCQKRQQGLQKDESNET